MAFRVTRGSTSKLLPMAFGVSVNRSDGFTAPHVADDRTDARTYSSCIQRVLICIPLQHTCQTAMSDQWPAVWLATSGCYLIPT